MPGIHQAPRTTRQVDVVVVGAGAAGIAAGRRLMQEGASIAMVEARNRAGGRAWTSTLDGAPVDLGAHWIHAIRTNPIVPLARVRDFKLDRSKYSIRLFRNGRALSRTDRHTFETLVDQAEWRIVNAGAAAGRGVDSDARTAMGDFGEWTEAVAYVKGAYECGADLRNLSAHDFWRADDHGDFLCRGGFGSLIASLAEGLPITFEQPVEAIARSEEGIVVQTPDQTISARSAIVTLPVSVLAAQSVRFDPPLPDSLVDAFARFTMSAYEHAVIALDDAPWGNERDQMVFSIAEASHLVLFGSIEGRPLHYVELCGEEGVAVAALGEDDRRRMVEAILEQHFGAACRQRARVLAVTGWGRDPWSRGCWSLCRPGDSHLRKDLRENVDETIWFAGEASSISQWGTVGGAWREGIRAADSVLRVFAGLTA